MKKKIILIVVATFATIVSVSATEWNFTNLITASTTYSTTGEVQTPTGVTDLCIISLKMAADVGQTAKKWTTGSYTARLKTGGGGGVGQANAIVIKVTGNSTIQICAVSSNSGESRKLEIKTQDGTLVGSVLVSGANPTTSTPPESFTYTGGETQLFFYSAPQETDPATDGYTAGGLNFYMINATNTTTLTPSEVYLNATGLKAAISTDLLNKAGCKLQNPTNLPVEIYSAEGKKVITSTASTICVKYLSSGVYIAKTPKGNLKFIK